MDINEYLYIVLLPAAQVFSQKFPEGSAPFIILKKGRLCRVKFSNKNQEKEWCDFCKRNELKNDSNLEY